MAGSLWAVCGPTSACFQAWRRWRGRGHAAGLASSVVATEGEVADTLEEVA